MRKNTAAEIAELHKQVAALTQAVESLRARTIVVENINTRLMKASHIISKYLDEASFDEAQSRAGEIAQMYQGTMMMLATVEMVLHTLWRTPVTERPIELADAAVRMLRLMGHGPDYFMARDQLTINDWIKLLARVTEADMPHQSQPLAWEAA